MMAFYIFGIKIMVFPTEITQWCLLRDADTCPLLAEGMPAQWPGALSSVRLHIARAKPSELSSTEQPLLQLLLQA